MKAWIIDEQSLEKEQKLVEENDETKLKSGKK